MQQRLDACSIVSPFEGIVDKVLFVKGEVALWPKTLIMSQLNPIGVNVKMSRDKSNKISLTTPVTIIVPNSSKKQGVFGNFSILTGDGITFLTSNNPVVDGNSKNAQTPVIRSCKEVIRFFIDSPYNKTLAVPVKALYKDNIGYYVWKAENQRNMRPDKGINSTFPVERIYVVQDNMQRMHGGFETIQALKNPGTLKEFDLVIEEMPKNMKNGDLVNFPQPRYTLMPGDKVKVIVGKE